MEVKNINIFSQNDITNNHRDQCGANDCSRGQDGFRGWNNGGSIERQAMPIYLAEQNWLNEVMMPFFWSRQILGRLVGISTKMARGKKNKMMSLLCPSRLPYLRSDSRVTHK